jgi:hypothetical protein
MVAFRFGLHYPLLAMPTSKLWLEHTERAAWDSVEALRERLLKAEQRLQALAPHVDGLPRLLDLLETAKQKFGTAASSHDEVVAELLTRLETVAAELDAAKLPPPTVMSFSGAGNDAARGRARLDSDSDADVTHELDDEPDITDFVHAVQRRHESSQSQLPADLNRLLELAETKLDDLAELEGVALHDTAIDLAVLAARIDAAARQKP